LTDVTPKWESHPLPRHDLLKTAGRVLGAAGDRVRILTEIIAVSVHPSCTKYMTPKGPTMTNKDDHKDAKAKSENKNNNVQSPDELTDESLGKVSGGAPKFGFTPNAPGKNPGARKP
jgi:hypothetical protein